jgi:hypothetical protein
MKYFLLLLVLGCSNRDTYDYLNKKPEVQPATVEIPQPVTWVYPTPTTINNYNYYNINFYVNKKGSYGIECNGLDSFIQVPDEFFTSPTGAIEILVYSYGKGKGPVSGLVHKGVEHDYSDESVSLFASNEDDDDDEEDDDKDDPKKHKLHLKTRVWHHVVMTWDEKNIYIYRDGKLISTEARVIKLNPAPLLICAQTKDKFDDKWGRLSFYGKMEHIMVYNKCLNKDEVGALYLDSK